MIIRGPPAEPTAKNGTPSFLTMVGEILGNGVLPGRMALAIVGRALCGADTHFRAEAGHGVVHHEASAGNSHAAVPAVTDSLLLDHHISEPIHHGEVRRTAGIALRLDPLGGGILLRFIHVDLCRQRFHICLV